jgi:hypothetical protein
MHKSHAEVMDLGASELLHWQIYYNIYPFDDTKDYYLNANVLAMLYNINRGERMRPMAPDDFLPTFMHPQPAKTVGETIRMLKLMATQGKPK